MKYIDLLNHFWTLNKEYSFTPNEKAVYFALLYKWNDLHRKNPFNVSNDTLAGDSGCCERSVQRAKKVLLEAGLIDYKKGDGRKVNTVYAILDAEKGGTSVALYANKGSMLDTLYDEKGGQKGSISVTLSDRKSLIKGDSDADYIDKSIEESMYNVKKGEERGEEEEIRSQKTPVPLGNSSVYSSMNDVEIICLTQSTMWLESMTKRLSLKNLEEAKNWVIDFFEEQRAAGQDKREITDAKSHCYSWVKIQKEKNKTAAPKGKAEAVLELNASSTDYWEQQKQAHLNNQNNNS